MKPDPKKVEAIAKMAKPVNKTELQIILGMANYLAKFAPHLNDVTAPIRDLLKKDSEFGHATRNSVHQDERHCHPISSVSIL